MTRPKTPCHQCNERTPTCHGTCKRYIAYREQLEQYNKEHAMVWADWSNMRKPRKNEKKLSNYSG